MATLGRPSYKANTAILNALLTIMNERILHEVGMAPQRVPLLSLFAASNETPQDSALKALDDRFLLRQEVSYIHDDSNFVVLLTQPLDDDCPPGAVLQFSDIAVAQSQVTHVKGAADVLEGLMAIRAALSVEGVTASDRKWRQCVRLLKARAWLDGQDVIEMEHLTCLVHALWISPDEQKTVQRVVYQVANPLALQAVEIEDQAMEIFGQLPKDEESGFQETAQNILQQMADMDAVLQQKITLAQARNTKRAEQAIVKIKGLRQQVAKKLFASVERITLGVGGQ